MKYLITITGLFVGAFFVFNVSCSASALNGVTVSPAMQQVQLAQNQNSVTFDTSVTNNTPKPIVVQVSAEDFTSLNQTGAISFINSQQASNNQHGLVNYVSIGYNQIALIPHQSQTVPITVLNANQLAAGGHYAAIVYKVNGQTTKGSNNVSISQAVSSLVFLSTYGMGTQTTTLQSVISGSLLTNFPSSISLVIQNSGNTQTTPRGNIQIINSKGVVVSQDQINTISSLILPGSNRLFNFPVERTKTHIWPGYYTLKIYYRYDGQVGYNVYQKKFLYVGWPIIAGFVAIIILLLVFLVRKFIPNKYYRLK